MKALVSLYTMRFIIHFFFYKLTYTRTQTYTGCPRRNVPHFRTAFLILKYTDITQNTYVQSSTVTEIMAREKRGLLAVPNTANCTADTSRDNASGMYVCVCVYTLVHVWCLHAVPPYCYIISNSYLCLCSRTHRNDLPKEEAYPRHGYFFHAAIPRRSKTLFWPGSIRWRVCTEQMVLWHARCCTSRSGM